MAQNILPGAPLEEPSTHHHETEMKVMEYGGYLGDNKGYLIVSMVSS